MTAKSMDVFALRDKVVDEYRTFATSFTKIHAGDIKAQVEAIYAENRHWLEPLLQITPNYRRAQTIQDLVDEGAVSGRWGGGVDEFAGERIMTGSADAVEDAERGMGDWESLVPPMHRAVVLRDATLLPEPDASWPPAYWVTVHRLCRVVLGWRFSASGMATLIGTDNQANHRAVVALLRARADLLGYAAWAIETNDETQANNDEALPQLFHGRVVDEIHVAMGAIGFAGGYDPFHLSAHL